MINPFLTLFFYFELSFMHTSRMAAAAIGKKTLFVRGTHFRHYFLILKVSYLHKSKMAATAILEYVS